MNLLTATLRRGRDDNTTQTYQPGPCRMCHGDGVIYINRAPKDCQRCNGTKTEPPPSEDLGR